ncbi:single-stranded-DNA-specific exonuclease RecJ [Hydrogenispora ethanolica]|uniref:Single-stranded-DNA-specific exonuclease RecJ n=1 Tax=Hydrogenispora ethanolica TaxID=1082276 RepID=A0A4R1RGV4_HYDET|nr:single-stranded-DNA-specific exonuclease RecJ [Hydrogenispora ethanolica]TCL65263.1 single-stranded-DNA-specific exonuclease RecJ [Hydrogenispora ethanolica]
MTGKVWRIAAHPHNLADELAERLGISALLARLLVNRGLSDPQAAQLFLAPTLNQLHDPFQFQMMQRAVERIGRAIRDQEYVLIYGDYDVDGITSVSLMIRVLARLLPGKLLYYLPKRLEEGYGLHLSSIEKALARGVGLIITVDCGITAVEEAAYLAERGVDLIITDHHESQETLPAAYAIIDPKLPGEGYPFQQLAGVGVAFKLLQGVATAFPEIRERLFSNLDLVAFGTVADIVPLLGENRVLVKYGLMQLQKTENIGLQALIQTAALADRAITSGHIGFVLAPRVNAAGRMGNPSIGVRLFLTNDPVQALDLAKQLEKENLNRQSTENQVLTEAQQMLAAAPELAEEYGLVLAGEGWHLGVIGIVASRLVEIYNKPVILIGLDGAEGRGSGRSIHGFNLFNAIDHCSGHLIRFGGHEFAAGLSIAREQIPGFRQAFQEYAKAHLTPENLRPMLNIESLLDLNRVTLDLARELEMLAPCGPANPTPVFGCRAVRLVDYKGVGENGKHLKLRVSDQQVTREGIGFNLGFVLDELASTSELDLAFSLEENHWNGSVQIQLNLKDVVRRGSE